MYGSSGFDNIGTIRISVNLLNYVLGHNEL